MQKDGIYVENYGDMFVSMTSKLMWEPTTGLIGLKWEFKRECHTLLIYERSMRFESINMQETI